MEGYVRNTDVLEIMIYVVQRQLSACSSLTVKECLWSLLFLIMHCGQGNVFIFS
jgi:hypothetical protein